MLSNELCKGSVDSASSGSFDDSCEAVPMAFVMDAPMTHARAVSGALVVDASMIDARTDLNAFLVDAPMIHAGWLLQ